MNFKNNPVTYFLAFMAALLLALGGYNFIQRQFATSTTDQASVQASDSNAASEAPAVEEPLSEADAAVLGTVLGMDKPKASNRYNLIERLNSYKTSWSEEDPSWYSSVADTAYVTENNLHQVCVVLLYKNAWQVDEDRESVWRSMKDGMTYWWGDDKGQTDYTGQGAILISSEKSTQCISDANNALGW